MKKMHNPIYLLNPWPTVIITMIMMLASSFGASADAPDPFENAIVRGDTLYNSGKYKEAASIYEEVIGMSGSSAPLLYNLGNALYLSDQPAKAVLCYERALKLDPSDDRIRNNLEYVYSRVSDRNKAELKVKNHSVGPDTPSFFSLLYSNVAEQTTSDFWALFAAFSFVLTLGAISLYIFSGNVPARKTGFFGGILFALLTVVFLVFSFMAANAYYSKDAGIIMSYKTELLTEPYASAKPSTTMLNAGTKLQVLDIQKDAKGNATWYKVRLNSEFMGWIKADDFELI